MRTTFNPNISSNSAMVRRPLQARGAGTRRQIKLNSSSEKKPFPGVSKVIVPGAGVVNVHRIHHTSPEILLDAPVGNSGAIPIAISGDRLDDKKIIGGEVPNAQDALPATGRLMPGNRICIEPEFNRVLRIGEGEEERLYAMIGAASGGQMEGDARLLPAQILDFAGAGPVLAAYDQGYYYAPKHGLDHPLTPVLVPSINIRPLEPAEPGWSTIVGAIELDYFSGSERNWRSMGNITAGSEGVTRFNSLDITVRRKGPKGGNADQGYRISYDPNIGRWSKIQLAHEDLQVDITVRMHNYSSKDYSGEYDLAVLTPVVAICYLVTSLFN